MNSIYILIQCLPLLNDMNVKPLASESLGVRSMATYVETKDCKILIDPSAALGPKRYGLSPHQKERIVLSKTKESACRWA